MINLQFKILADIHVIGKVGPYRVINLSNLVVFTTQNETYYKPFQLNPLGEAFKGAPLYT